MNGDLYAAAMDMADRCIPVFPCNASKEPIVAGGFQAATLDPTPALFAGAALIGTPTGVAGGYDVLDIDPRHGGDVWLAENLHRLPATRVQNTQSGGVHYYFRARPDMRCSISRISPGIDVRAEGGYVIRWDASGLPTRNPDALADWPEWLADLARGPRVRHGENPDRSSADLAPPSPRAVIRLLERMPNPAEATRDDYIRVMMAAKGCIDGLDATGLLDHFGCEEVATAAIEWAARWPGSPGFQAESEKWEADFATRNAPLAGWQNLLAAAARLGVDTSGERAEGAADEFWAVSVPKQTLPAVTVAPTGNDEPDAWKSVLQRTEKGFPRANLLNARLALRNAPEWRGVLAHNVFADRVILLAPPPWLPRTAAPFVPRSLVDDDATRTAIFLQDAGIQVAAPCALEAAISVALETPFDPVRSRIEAVTWDMKGRCDTWLIDYLGAEDTPLTRAFCAKFLLSAVARLMKPGCQVDTVLVLEGGQGMRKSSVLRALFCDYFTDHLPELSSKDAALQLQGIWGLEFAELAVLGRADAARVKEFISRRVDRLRRPFGKLAEDVPRRCVFAASVNPGGLGYLKDETGARRFWPVKCGVGWPEDRKANVAEFAEQVPQLWAEAIIRLAAGEPWWLADVSLEQEQRAATAGRFEGDVWTEQVRLFLSTRADASALDVLCGALGKVVGDLSAADNQRVGRILTHEGWIRKQVRIESGAREWRYFRGDSVVDIRPAVTTRGAGNPVTNRISAANTAASARKPIRSSIPSRLSPGDSTSKGYPF